MKKLSLKRELILIFIICFVGGIKAQATKAEQSLWGEWRLESLQQTLVENNQEKSANTFSLDNMINARSTPQENVFLLIYMFDNNVGVSSTDNNYEYLQINNKGTFIVTNDRFIISLNREESESVFDFKYVLNGEQLTLTIEQASERYPLVKYKRTLVYNRIIKEGE